MSTCLSSRRHAMHKKKLLELLKSVQYFYPFLFLFFSYPIPNLQFNIPNWTFYAQLDILSVSFLFDYNEKNFLDRLILECKTQRKVTNLIIGKCLRKCILSHSPSGREAGGRRENRKYSCTVQYRCLLLGHPKGGLYNSAEQKKL